MCFCGFHFVSTWIYYVVETVHAAMTKKSFIRLMCWSCTQCKKVTTTTWKRHFFGGDHNHRNDDAWRLLEPGTERTRQSDPKKFHEIKNKNNYQEIPWNQKNSGKKWTIMIIVFVFDFTKFLQLFEFGLWSNGNDGHCSRKLKSCNF